MRTKVTKNGASTKKNKGGIKISDAIKDDIEMLCEYILDTEKEDYDNQIEFEGASEEEMESHSYAIASRIWDAINKENNNG